MKNELYSTLFEYLYPLISNLNELQIDENEESEIGKKERILIEGCYRSQNPDYITRIQPLLLRYQENEKNLLFIIRITYETEFFDDALKYCNYGLEHYPEASDLIRNIVCFFGIPIILVIQIVYGVEVN